MSWLWPTLIALLIGAALSLQPVINGISSGILNSIFAAATLSLFVSTLAVFGMFLMRGDAAQMGSFFDLPWWVVLGGLIGAVFVSGGAALVPVMGATTFFVCLIAGQLVGAVIADAIGAFGLEQRAFSMRKFAGVALAFAGVVLVRSG